jgi:hypothetical protein
MLFASVEFISTTVRISTAADQKILFLNQNDAPDFFEIECQQELDVVMNIRGLRVGKVLSQSIFIRRPLDVLQNRM